MVTQTADVLTDTENPSPRPAAYALAGPRGTGPPVRGGEVIASDLVKTYGATEALRLDRLNVAPGETVGLVGNNGAGKTTLLRLVLDLIRPTAGSVTLDGMVVSQTTAWKPRVSAFLDPSFLIGYLRPGELFRLVGGSYGLSAAEAARRAEAYADFLGPPGRAGPGSHRPRVQPRSRQRR